jgi:c(7)-type cytochrome triheme protein
MAHPLQDFLFLKASRTLVMAAALVAGALAIAGAAVAQDAAAPAPSIDSPQDLFGGLPEPATEEGPPPPVLDPANPDHAKLQQPKEAYAGLPLDARGRPDWVRALRDGLIQPRASVRGGPEPMTVLDLDVLMKNTAQMGYVRFSHGVHTQWLACTNCHDALFVPKAGANPTTMPKILAGESCGVCHAKVAFTAMFTCERCHSEPQPGQQKWW